MTPLQLTSTRLADYKKAAEKLTTRLDATIETGAALHPSVAANFNEDVPGEWIDLFVMVNPFLFRAVIEAFETATAPTPALTQLATVVLMAP